jgi:hypothetical protein
VVKHLNDDIGLTTEFFKFMLSRANLVQVNQFTERKDDGVAFSRFDVIWPPTFTGKIKFSASDFQSNKKSTSRLAFSVGNERGTKTADDSQTQEPDSGVEAPARLSADDLNQIGREPRLTGPGARASRQSQDADFDEKTLGRKKKG